MNLIENATEATETIESVEVSAQNIEETTKENMNEINDTLEASTENSVEEIATKVEIENAEISSVEEVAAETVSVEVENIIVEENTFEVFTEAPIENTIENIEIPAIEASEEIAAPIEPATPVEVAHSEAIIAAIDIAAIEPVEEIQPMAIEPVEEVHSQVEVDYSNFEKKDFVDLGEKLLASIKAESVTASDMKNADVVMREIKPIFDDLKAREKSEALKKYIADNGNNEGFDFKNDNYVVRFESLNAQIRDAKSAFFKKMDRLKEDYFETKTKLLQRLRETVEAEEKGGTKNNWQEFKKIQEDWKNAGNVNSPHNTTLWSAYNALVDRYFSIRNIQNELKDLDRKKNFTAKSEVVLKIETIANAIGEGGLSNTTLRQANDLLEEYKHIGPAAREAQDELWTRLKSAFDIIHNKRREQSSQTN